MNILHLTYDYPDSINPNKTVAMKNIIDLSKDVCDKVFYISLNRISNKKDEIVIKKQYGIEMSNFGLSKGLLFRYTLNHSIEKVDELNINFNEFDLIHAHKLTFEGPIAYYIHKQYNKNYIVSIQQTDFKIWKLRPDLRFRYKKILKSASKVVIISPWMKRQLKNILDNKLYYEIEKKIVLLPLLVNGEQIFNCENNDKFVTVFNLMKKNLKIKNIKRTLKAISELKQKGINIHLDIIGSGDGKEYIETIIKKYEIGSNVKLIGSVENGKIIKALNQYKAFILCSYPETFGMVYVEALKAGLPIIYSKNAGVDGYFTNYDIGISVNSNNINEIKNAFIVLSNNFKKYKNNVLEMQKVCFLKLFSRESIINLYNNIYRF